MIQKQLKKMIHGNNNNEDRVYQNLNLRPK